MAANLLTIADLRGGINNSDSPTLLNDNEVVDARNVDSHEGALGAKRRGTEGISIAGSTFNSPVNAIIRHTPTNALTNDELWGIDENGNIDRRVGGTWQGGVARVNDFVVVNARNFDANGASLHGKLFIAAQGTQNRLLVWDGTVLRFAGLAQPPDPTVADSAAAGSYSGTRYFRIRYVARNASGAVLRRSEPTHVVSLAPVGTKTGAVITKPSGTEATTSAYCEGQTNWEVEASIDNILFYRIATVAIATSTYTDTTAYTTGYSANPLSESIGEYIPPNSARHVAVDEDRIVIAGDRFTELLDSRVSWTPVAGDDGVGNDERIPTTTRNYINFDGLDGGRVTALVSGVAGNTYVFKASRIRKMVRTGIAAAAYEPVSESAARGATLRGAVAGTDHLGVPCVYFLDQSAGLCRVGQRGVETLSKMIRVTWRGRNPDALISARILYYPVQEQVWYTTPTGAAEPIYTSEGLPVLTATSDEINVSQTAPNTLVIYEVRYGGSWLQDTVLGTTQALALITRDTGLVPVIGTQLTSIGGGNTSYLHYGDTGNTDSGTPFLSYVRTKPYTMGGLWAKFGIMAAVLLGKAVAGTTLGLKFLRNFGVEEKTVTVNMSPANAEVFVVKPVDNASMSDLNAVQIEIGDAAASAQQWSLDQMVFKVRSEDRSA